MSVLKNKSLLFPVAVDFCSHRFFHRPGCVDRTLKPRGSGFTETPTTQDPRPAAGRPERSTPRTSGPPVNAGVEQSRCKKRARLFAGDRVASRDDLARPCLNIAANFPRLLYSAPDAAKRRDRNLPRAAQPGSHPLFPVPVRINISPINSVRF